MITMDDQTSSDVVESIPAKLATLVSRSLTDKQSKFVEAYKQLNNGPQAAISAGYSAKSAHVEANRLLKHPTILLQLDTWRKSKNREISKGDFIDLALGDYRSLENTEPNKPRFLDIAGKALGYTGSQASTGPQTVNNVQINVNEIKIMAPGDKWNAIRGALEGE